MVSIEDTDDAMSVMIRFLDEGPNSLYSYSVSKRYPYICPQIKCLSIQQFASTFIDIDGLVVHPDVSEKWSGLSTLYNAIEILSFIRVHRESLPYQP